jgi:hypothetical protein
MPKFVNLSTDQALSPNDDLWILSETSSSLFHRLDWLLNFQLTQALTHKSPVLSEKITAIVEQCGLRSISFKGKPQNAFWLVGSHSFLPCDWLLLAPVKNFSDLDEWWTTLQSRIESLGSTHVRFFLSSEISPASLSKLSGKSEIRYSMLSLADRVSAPSTETTQWI